MSTLVPALRVGSAVSVSLKYVSLCVLVIQTTTLVLTMRYSRTSGVADRLYLSSTAVFLAEILKMFICLVVIRFLEASSILGLWKLLNEEVFTKPKELLKLSIPAILYTIQNNLLFIALSLLDAATYQVTYQLKILTTAIFSVFLLQKSLVRVQWGALVLLMIGVALVQMPSSSDSQTAHRPFSIIGLLAVLCACCSSGFSGVYFEKILKGSKQSLWIRNVQLAFGGILFGLVGVFTNDYQAVMEHGFLQGYNTLTWITICLQACGGLVIGVVVKYADNILKGFATSVSLVLSAVVSFYVLKDLHPSPYFLAGASLVIFATLLYSRPPPQKLRAHGNTIL